MQETHEISTLTMNVVALKVSIKTKDGHLRPFHNVNTYSAVSTRGMHQISRSGCLWGALSPYDSSRVSKTVVQEPL